MKFLPWSEQSYCYLFPQLSGLERHYSDSQNGICIIIKRVHNIYCLSSRLLRFLWESILLFFYCATTEMRINALILKLFVRETCRKPPIEQTADKDNQSEPDGD